MGASGWSYTVPYQPDLNAALHELRERVFAEGRYYWAVGDYCRWTGRCAVLHDAAGNPTELHFWGYSGD
ncbi:hypothetical protein DLE60_23765 [Micromonospora globispora]|uniref:Uncharacterized protein n=1 Tax=Micromonospora globispora TaxID=1450148 RepID=A0A317KA71_9ACTN|nr:hypothetical protein [Micromonospora globispora]PWU50199.1 hypothetical protein DLJ46_07665 [Micromonospora globispora]PWU57824.1 hypothetical protein DLE60_23765 [Micromonospora globispora]RQX01489.1 hypothetical protein DKL51_05490 [Micromonospora globispora]